MMRYSVNFHDVPDGDHRAAIDKNVLFPDPRFYDFLSVKTPSTDAI